MDKVFVSDDHSTVKPRVSDRNDTGNIIVPSSAMNEAFVILALLPFTAILLLPVCNTLCYIGYITLGKSYFLPRNIYGFEYILSTCLYNRCLYPGAARYGIINYHI